MSLPAYLQGRITPLRPYLLLTFAVVVGLVAGIGLAWLFRDPHTAAAERLVGTVTWSNADDRIIAFEADGEIRDPLLGDTIYSVISDQANYPACLTGRADDPVRDDRRRVELDAIHQDHGGPQKSHIAVSVRCLG
jgi:HEAT repeat protein